MQIHMVNKGVGQKVVVILTTTTAATILSCMSVNGVIKWLMNALPLLPGDELVLLPVLRLCATALILKLGICKGQDQNEACVSAKLRQQREEYQKITAIVGLQNLCEAHKIKVSVEVEAVPVGSSRRAAAVRAAARLGATWIILDREMKKDKRYFMDRLSCRMSSMKSNNTIMQLRGPINYQAAASSNTSKPLLCSVIENERKRRVEMEYCYSVCTVCKNRRLHIAGLQRDFTYTELVDATEGFCRDNFLSEGGFGSVYKGVMKGGVRIAVKRLKAESLQGEKEFKSEVRVLSQVQHENLVVLLGSCTEGSHRLLVYEYVCNGSLERHLWNSNSKPLKWKHRMKIALGAARGLAYLHSHNIVHRDVRPSNILITHDYDSMLGDCGLARAQPDGIHSDSSIVGTLGYMAPEYAESGKMSTKADVYAFGVVLLQLITGLRTTDEMPGGKSLVGWAKPLLETRNYPDLVDKRILESYDVHQLFWMVLVAEKCLKKDPGYRSTMEQVVRKLSGVEEHNRSFDMDLFK